VYNSRVSYIVLQPLSEKERAKLGAFSPLLAHLLFHRGIVGGEEAERFISPNYENGTHDPFLLKDAEKAAIRVISAIDKGERIAIYSDYDADGIPGAAIFNDFFQRIGYKNYSVYIPHRHDEGFGVNAGAVELLASEGVKLMITIDCGITDVEPIKLAREKGIDVIITDHHEAPVQLPEAYAIIDHKQVGCMYPDKNLCGSGVAYKLIQAILKKDRFGLKDGMEKWLLDLVGIATMSDMVPLMGENRIFAHYGLAVLRKSPRKGIMQLLRKLGINQRHLTEDDIAFMITPRINAASRMGVPMDAFKLLAADNDDDAYTAANHLDKINNERKGVVASLVKEVKKILHTRYAENIQYPVPAVIVMGNPDWRPSLLGLVANSVAEEYSRPVFLWGRDGDNIIKGSCRSGGKTDLVALMRAVPVGSLGHFGGHKQAGGFEVHNDAIHFLEKHLNDAHKAITNLSAHPFGGSSFSPPACRQARQTPQGGIVEKLSPQTGEMNVAGINEDMIDMELSLDEVSYAFHDDLNKLAPFGMANPKPIFLFKKVSPSSVRTFGKTNNHVELVFKKSNGVKIPAISFFGAENEWAKTVQVGKPIDLVASVEKSLFRGREELRLRIIDTIQL